MNRRHDSLLFDLAHQAMIDRGLLPEFTPPVLKQVAGIQKPAAPDGIRDLRTWLWCSIDNDDSRDLDQLTFAESLPNQDVRLYVAVADVDALVRKDTPIDDHARHNTTSVYTAARVFPMLPEKLSTDLSSLNEKEDRVALIVEMTVKADGTVGAGTVYSGHVHNNAKLTYNAVGDWLEGEGEMPPKVAAIKGLAENLQLQNAITEKMRDLRHEHGALDLETIEARPVMQDGKVVDLRQEKRNRARLLIEDSMIAANGVTARFLETHKFPSIRRVVRSPERWDRIEAIATERGARLPPEPDARALEEFLVRQRKADPVRFPDLSLAIVKAMGAGEYVLERAGEDSIGHFGLAVRDYTHSTAPNRRFPDLITHRLLKAVLANEGPAYGEQELGDLAQHCTQQEDAANKVERQVRKSAAASLLSSRIGDRFDGIVTGASQKGTWARVFSPPTEGKVVQGEEGLDIGDRLRVKLIGVDIERGHIDFVRIKR